MQEQGGDNPDNQTRTQRYTGISFQQGRKKADQETYNRVHDEL
jgi:hypothetical protein